MQNFTVEKDVLGSGEPWDQRKFLVNHANACLEGIMWVPKTNFLAIDVNLAGIASGLGNDAHPEEDVHQGRLAGTILANKAEDLAAVQVDGDIGQDPVSKVLLGDALHSQQRLLLIQVATFQESNVSSSALQE
jgi:hypothetical protein